MFTAYNPATFASVPLTTAQADAIRAIRSALGVAIADATIHGARRPDGTPYPPGRPQRVAVGIGVWGVCALRIVVGVRGSIAIDSVWQSSAPGAAVPFDAGRIRGADTARTLSALWDLARASWYARCALLAQWAADGGGQ